MLITPEQALRERVNLMRKERDRCLLKVIVYSFLCIFSSLVIVFCLMCALIFHISVFPFSASVIIFFIILHNFYECNDKLISYYPQE